MNKTYYIVEDLICFINNVLKIDKKIDKKKLKNSINSTSFDKLKLFEQSYGFSEAMNSKDSKNNIPFFYLGPDNNWKKILDQKFQEKLNVTFEKSLKYFSYF